MMQKRIIDKYAIESLCILVTSFSSLPSLALEEQPEIVIEPKWFRSDDKVNK